MIIQTPELIIQKRFEAENHVGKYLLVLAVFKNGLVFGRKFNKRQNKPGQWLLEINPHCVIGGIGAFNDFNICISALYDFCQNSKNILGKNYMTGEGIRKFLANTLRESFNEETSALAVNFLVADLEDGKNPPSLWFIDYDGKTKPLQNFAVAGGSEYEEPLTEAEIKKIPAKEKRKIKQKKSELIEKGVLPSFLMKLNRIINPRKNAVNYLEKNWAEDMKKESVIELVKNALLICNPESKSGENEITIIACDEMPECLYFPVPIHEEKIKQDEKSPASKDAQEEI